MYRTRALCATTIATKPVASTANTSQLPFLPTTGDLLRMLRVGAKKSMSQNFILDMNVNRKIISLMPSFKDNKLADAHVCEVGAGPGGITRALLERQVASVTAIEIDKRFFPMLDLVVDASSKRLHLVHGDVLKFDWDNLWSLDYAEIEKQRQLSTLLYQRSKDPPILPSVSECHVKNVDWQNASQLPNAHIIGNLPFSVATPLVIRLLRDMSYRRGAFSVGRVPLTLMLQKEVGQRCVAPLDGDHRCRLSIMCQHLAHVNIAHTLPSACFTPRPQVDATIVTFIPRTSSLIPHSFELVEKFCRHMFHYRQKHAIHCARTLYPDEVQNEFAMEMFRRSAVNATHKCTELSMAELRDMCAVYAEQCQRMPGLWLYDYRQPHSQNMEELEKRDDKYPPVYPFEDRANEQDTLLADTENAIKRNQM